MNYSYNLIKKIIVGNKVSKEELEHKIEVLYFAGKLSDSEY